MAEEQVTINDEMLTRLVRCMPTGMCSNPVRSLQSVFSTITGYTLEFEEVPPSPEDEKAQTTVKVQVNGVTVTQASSKSRRSAKEIAAKNALSLLADKNKLAAILEAATLKSA